MNSDFDKEATASSDDLPHENGIYAYAAAEGDDAFYGEGEEAEDEVEAELIVDRAAQDKASHVTELPVYSRSSLFDFVYVGKEPEEEEEEEEEESGALEYDRLSAVRYDQARFRPVALSEAERQEIIQKLRDLFGEAKVLMIVNKFLHKTYIDVNRKSPSMANALDKFDESIIFEDTRYRAALEKFAQTRCDVDGRIRSLSTGLENLERSCSTAQSGYAQTFEDLLAQQLAVAKKTKPPKCAKEAWLAEVEQSLDNQRQRAAEVAKIRMAHVQLLGKLAKLTARLRKFDSLGPGFSMMDYEYLVKRKGVYSERRDEQREHMKKLKEKNLTSAAIIRHIDEEADLYNEKVSNNWDNLDVLVSGNKRERSRAVDLAKTKVSISKIMGKLRHEIGLLNYPYLLRKMERDLREIKKLGKRSDSLQAKMILDSEKIAECRL